MTTVARSTAVLRLRPGVAVTPLRAGLHLRGRSGSVTLEGSAALPALWTLLEEPLREGGLEALLDGMEPGSPLRGAVEVLLGQLEAHGLLTAGEAQPPGEDPVGRWLAESAQRPADAAAALAAARAEVLAGDPGGPLARAAVRALERGGLAVTLTAGPDLPGGRILLRLHGGGPGPAVAAGRAGAGGYATAPGSPAQAAADARALEARLGPAGEAGPGAFPELLAGTAAHRLLCAAAGLPDPAAEGGDERLLPGLPAVLLAESGPPRADYRTWLGPERIDADRRTGLAPARTLGEALRRLDALGDARCGVLPGPEPGGLAQLPVPLAACALPGGRLTGGAPRLDLARLELFCRAAEVLMGQGEFTVGANPGHARGRALRAAAARRGPGAAVPEAEWSGHPQARHWWTTLTARLGVPARLEVRRTAPGEEAYHAVVLRTGTAAPGPLGEAVEATPGDAASFAALAAVSTVTATVTATATATATDPAERPHAVRAGSDATAAGWDAVPAAPGAAPTATAAPERPRAVPAGPDGVPPTPAEPDAAPAGPGAQQPPPSGGAVAPLAVAGARIAAWEDPGWTNGWMADVARREAGLQAALERITGAAFAETGGGFAETGAACAETGAAPPVAGASSRAAGLAVRLRAFGFTVLNRAPEEAR
ncbi:hypothetical protein [Streptomyces sp. NPDC059708]|uniref:hypothetical protein n=1 Tax=Streptomyces sp. NPDC059708 TaxID=3346916 RepID=UPI0036D0F83A